ncbi:unnamed protein product [Hyaloperonospora brassicae]|uniref:Uncharacterized protein n=1 Tax=Hyaloperonospora brassicae TaxID=162125 RepID=A0AAV0SVZ9_HYABA|nr:unnamed protein product [Hyaloperonospora brassicae]
MSSSSSSSKNADRKLRPYSTSTRRDRRRPKHELEYLRAKVVELQEELMTLGLSSWKEIAERQKREVATAVDKNRQLRNRLLNQLQVAHALEASIRQHESDAATLCQYEWMNTGMSEEDRSSFSRIMDEQIFAQLNSTLETQLAEIDSVFTTHGLSSVLHKLQGGFAFNREANGISFRYEEARLLPFPWQALHHTIWNSLHDGSIYKHTEAQVLSHDRSNLIFRDTIELSKSRPITITKWAAFRRHIEQDRVVFVWNIYVQIDGSLSVRLTERGWTTTSTFEFHRDVSQGTNDSSDFVQGCITRMAVQLIPEVSEFKSKQEARMHVGEMADHIVGYFHHNYSFVHEVAEKLLQSSPGTDGNEEGVKSGVVQMF